MAQEQEYVGEYESGSESGSGTGSEEIYSWAYWFTQQKGKEYYCMVDDEFIRDKFNITGIGHHFERAQDAYDCISLDYGTYLNIHYL